MSLPAAQSRSLPAPARRWTAAICALLIWGLGLLAVSPQLHAAIHPDADHANHECAVTLFSHGVDAGMGLPTMVEAPLLSVSDLCPVAPALPATDTQFRLPPACGPPVR